MARSAAGSCPAVTGAGGIALRYGIFYGDPDVGLVEAVRARKFPIAGDGAGVWSFIHLDDAAAATVLALEHDGPAVYNIVDDEPSATREWLPELGGSSGPSRRNISPACPPGSSRARRRS